MSQPKQEDNLKLIKGVGTSAESRLRKAGIFSYASLASQTPETLGNLIGYPSSKQNTLQGWIKEAKHLTGKPHKKQVRKPAHTDISSRQRYATFTVEILLDHSDRVRRTQVVHVQSGDEVHWPAWDDIELTNYIVQKANIKRPPQPKARKNHINTKDAASRGKTDLIQSSLPFAGTKDRSHVDDTQPFSVSILDVSLIPQDAKLHLQCRMELSGLEALEITTKQLRFIVEVVAFNLLTSQADILTICEDTLQPDQLKYSISAMFPAPKIGRYLLETIVLIPEVDVITIHRGPRLTTIP